MDAELEAELGPAAYLHTRVAASSLQRRPRYHKDASYALARLDTPLPAGGAYLAMGLNNDYDASYYWARLQTLTLTLTRTLTLALTTT